MRYGLLIALMGMVLLTTVPTAQASMKDFCAKRWHGNALMQQYCLDVEDQSVQRLAKLLDIIEATHDQIRAYGGRADVSAVHRCSSQHYLKIFDTYHNQLVEACLVQYLSRLQKVRQPQLQHTVSAHDF